jgi:hypothetical protein
MSERRAARLAAVAAAGALLLPLGAMRARAATLTVINRDAAGEGFHDETPVAPVGGNSGTTLGAQRLIAFEFAAGIWAAQLDSPVEIRITAGFDDLPCDANSVTLGVAGPISVFSDFAGALRPDTWYPAALANKLAGMDLDTREDDIEATFNSTFGTTCEFDARWYYGLDKVAPGNDSDFVTVALHELGHGLGFLTLIDVETGERLTSRDDPDGKDDAFMEFLFDNVTGKTFTEMTDAERADASVATQQLRWNGPEVVAVSELVTVGVDPEWRVELYAPGFPEPGSSVSHWSDEVRPIQLLGPFFETPLHDVGLALQALADIGWNAESALCQSDCNANGRVTIDELIVAVRIALGTAALDACLIADTSGNGAVEVNELVGAVGRALDGCAG